ncbi:MAG: hypothetical protein JWN11_49 [Hyphomicrobiales bacterium]|nr:hypothetical protein [Hyphomicrobiales bacterium]
MGRTSVIARALGLDKSFLERGFGQGGRAGLKADGDLLPNFAAIKAAAATSTALPDIGIAPKAKIVATGNTLIDAAAHGHFAKVELKPLLAMDDVAAAEETKTEDAKTEDVQAAVTETAAKDSAAEGQVSLAVQSSVAAMLARLGAAGNTAENAEPTTVDEAKMTTLLAELDRIWSRSKAEHAAPTP